MAHDKVYGFCEAKCKVEVVDKETVENIVRVFNNVSASSWGSSTKYPTYPIRCTIPLDGVTANDVAEVTFGITEASSGDYAPICETYDGGVYLYSRLYTTITVPTIIIIRGVIG